MLSILINIHKENPENQNKRSVFEHQSSTAAICFTLFQPNQKETVGWLKVDLRNNEERINAVTCQTQWAEGLRQRNYIWRTSQSK